MEFCIDSSHGCSSWSSFGNWRTSWFRYLIIFTNYCKVIFSKTNKINYISFELSAGLSALLNPTLATAAATLTTALGPALAAAAAAASNLTIPPPGLAIPQLGAPALQLRSSVVSPARLSS